MTHPETAWLVRAVPAWLAAAAVLTTMLLLRGRVTLAINRLRAHSVAQQHTRRPNQIPLDPALHWVAPVMEPGRWLMLCLVSTLATGLAAAFVPLFLMLAISGPLVLLAAWLGLASARQRYTSQLETALTAATGRLAMALRSGNGFRAALARVIADMPEGPLRAEWAFLIERTGVPLNGGGIATIGQVTAALAGQTPSRRHSTLLNHMAVALAQPQDAQTRRVEAAYASLLASEQRQSEMRAQLSQVRYSGMAIGGAGVFMAAYLALTQWERVVLAYNTPLGALVGVVVVGALALPVVGGILLSQAEDLEY